MWWLGAIPFDESVYVEIEGGHRDVELHFVKPFDEGPHRGSTFMLLITLNQSFLQCHQVPLVNLKVPQTFLYLQLLRLREFDFANLVHDIRILLVFVNVDGG